MEDSFNSFRNQKSFFFEKKIVSAAWQASWGVPVRAPTWCPPVLFSALFLLFVHHAVTVRVYERVQSNRQHPNDPKTHRPKKVTFCVAECINFVAMNSNI